MKKIICIILSALLLGCVNVSAENPVTVEVNYLPVQFDAEPINVDGRILAPVRQIFEAMGATVRWNEHLRTVTSVRDYTTVVMTIDQHAMRINGEPVTLDVAPRIVNDRTMIPIRAAAEAFGERVRWIPEENKAVITTKSFLQRIEDIKTYSSVRKLNLGETEAISAFSLSYFPEYETLTAAPDGTDFEIIAAGDGYCAILGIRSDIYIGTPATLTDEYVKSVAEDMATLSGGTLISSGVVDICNTECMKIRYTAHDTAENITDETADITTYMGIHDGVVYTMKLSVYGDVPHNILSDLNYMTTTLLIK